MRKWATLGELQSGKVSRAAIVDANELLDAVSEQEHEEAEKLRPKK